MRVPALLLLSGCLATGVVVSADNDGVDCAHRSLADVVRNAGANQTIRFTGVCTEPVVIKRNGITLKGVGAAVIDGGGADAVTVAGATRVTLTNIEIRNGANGVAAVNGANVQLKSLNVHDNAAIGITVQTGSSAALSDVIASHNGVHGLDVQTGSAASVTGVLTASFNRVFGINVNGSAITFTQATVTASSNAVGVQIATSANAFIGDAASAITTNDNLATGFTVVSGAHLVSFGGIINASGNPVAGVSVNSKAGLDLDAGATINSTGNGDGLLIQEGSVMTVFNIPQFSGVPGFSTLNVTSNTLSGISVRNGSTLTLVNQAKATSSQNGRVGLLADNSAGVTLVNSTMTGNVTKDVQLTFGTRADFRTLTLGTYTCDATVLVRGTSGIVCPH